MANVSGRGGSNQGPNFQYSAPTWQQNTPTVPPFYGIIHPAVTFNLNRILDASVPTYPTANTDVRASSATYYNSSGVLSTASSNVLRTDYNPATLALRGILIEDTATNLLLQSVDISNAAWSGAGYTFSSDATLAPDGSTATKCTVTAGTSNKERYQQQPYTAGVTYTDTLYAKAGTNNYVYMSRQYASTISVAAVFDLSGTSDITASQTAVAGGGAPPSIISATGQYVGTGWFRLSLVSTQIAGDTAYYTIIGPVPAATGNVFTSGGEISWTAAGTETFYLFGPQREVGSVGTSYIPTTTATVTRAADSDSFTLNASATQLTFTFDDLSTQTVMGLTGGSTYTIPTNLTRPWILYIDDNSVAAANVGAAAGTSTVAAVGAALDNSIAAASGAATVSGVGAALGIGVGSAAGISTVTATGAALGIGVGSAAGTSTVTATGAALGKGVGNAASTSTVLATGQSTAVSVGASAGVSTVSGVGAALAASIGSAAGTSTDTATGSSLARGVGNAAGTSSALAVSGTVAVAAGTSTVTGVGAALFNAVGAAAGTSTVTATGVGAAFAVGVSSGTSTVSGIGKSLAVAVGSAAGAGTATGFSPSLIMQAVGLATGSSIIVGVGNAHRPGIWQIAVRGTMDIPTPWRIGNTAIDTIPTVPGAQSIYSDSTPDIYQVGDIYSQTAQNTWKVATRGNMDVQTAWKIAR